MGLAIDGQPISYDACKFSVQYRNGTIKKISINDLSLIDPELGSIYTASMGLKPGEKIKGTASYSENGQTVSTRIQLVFLNKPELKYRLILYVNKFNYTEYWGYPNKEDTVGISEVGKNIVVIESTFPIYYEQKYTWYSGDFKTDYYIFASPAGMGKIPTHLTVGGYIYDIGVVVPKFYGNNYSLRDEFVYGDLPLIENYYKTQASLYYNDNDTQYSYGLETPQGNPVIVNHGFGGYPTQFVTIYPPGEETSSSARKTYFGFSNIDSRPFGDAYVPISFESVIEKKGIPVPVLQGNYSPPTYDYSIVNPDLNIPYISLPYRDYVDGFIKQAHAWNCFMSGIITFSSDYRSDTTVNHNTSYKLADLSHTVDIVYDNSPHFGSFAEWKNNAIDIVKQTITDLGGEVGVIEQT